VAGDGRADSEAALRVEVADEPEERAVLALQPFVDGVVVVDGDLVVRRAELDPDRHVGQHHVDRRVARDLTQIAIGIVHVDAPLQPWLQFPFRSFSDFPAVEATAGKSVSADRSAKLRTGFGGG
jgi:hypothetical protein